MNGPALQYTLYRGPGSTYPVDDPMRAFIMPSLEDRVLADYARTIFHHRWLSARLDAEVTVLILIALQSAPEAAASAVRSRQGRIR